MGNLPLKCDQAKVAITLNLEVSTRPSPYQAFSVKDECESFELGEMRGMKTGRGLMGRFFGASKSSAKVMARVHRTLVWRSERHLTVDTSSDDKIKEIFTMPVAIDPLERKRCLREWPYPESLTHTVDENIARLLTFSCEGPLSKVRYVLSCEVMVSRQHQSRRVDHAKFVRLGSCEKEIKICPPQTTRLNSTAMLHSHDCRQRTVKSELTTGPVGSNQQTPHAKKAPVRVVGEIISRGPAAVLVDRGGRVPISQTTPECFAPLRHVSNQNVTCLLDTPVFSPTLAYVDSSLPERQIDMNLLETPRRVHFSPRVGHGSGAVPRDAHIPLNSSTVYQGRSLFAVNAQSIEDESQTSQINTCLNNGDSDDGDFPPQTRENDHDSGNRQELPMRDANDVNDTQRTSDELIPSSSLPSTSHPTTSSDSLVVTHLSGALRDTNDVASASRSVSQSASFANSWFAHVTINLFKLFLFEGQ